MHTLSRWFVMTCLGMALTLVWGCARDERATAPDDRSTASSETDSSETDSGDFSSAEPAEADPDRQVDVPGRPSESTSASNADPQPRLSPEAASSSTAAPEAIADSKSAEKISRQRSQPFQLPDTSAFRVGPSSLSSEPARPSTMRSTTRSPNGATSAQAPTEARPVGEAPSAAIEQDSAATANAPLTESGSSDHGLTTQGPDAQGAYSVKVFYGTDRARREEFQSALPWLDSLKVETLIALTLLATVATIGLLGYFLKARSWTATLLVLTSAAAVTLLGYAYYERESFTRYASVDYGNRRGTYEVGTCQVNIPPNHQPGELESPSILRLEVKEDLGKHVVLTDVHPMHDESFFEELRACVERAPRDEVFVFVHGYNVTFEDAARRTAQIAYDVNFRGAPIFFSWPSQGGLLQYTVDETNVSWAVPHLRQFLLDIARRSGARSINLIAHSMGNRALTRAIQEISIQLRDQQTLFNEVVLAAPDVDAEIFKRDLAPALIRSARRVTLYASANDQALVASHKVHGYPRAGDSERGLVVLPGIETIDVSTVDTSFLGHSYYGSSHPILLDLDQLLNLARPAGSRQFMIPMSRDAQTYWVFQPESTRTATRPRDR